MRKVCAAILSAAICLAVSGAPAWASEQQATLSAGYLHASTNVPGSDDLNGINVKYRYEFTDTLGLVTSFSYWCSYALRCDWFTWTHHHR
nr:hypothetical protein [Escherichia coli]